MKTSSTNNSLNLTILIGILATCTNTAAQTYDIIWIQPLPGATGSFPSEINDQRQIVGRCRFPDGTERAFIWEDGITTDLGTLGGRHTVAFDINQAGVVVGTSSDMFENDKAFIWTRQGGMRPYFRSSAGPNWLRGINERGDVVGGLDRGGVNYADVFRKTATGFEFLPRHYPISYVSVADINDDGIVIGFEVDDGSEFGLPRIWGKGTSAILPGGLSYHPLRINNGGQIAGAYYNFYNERPAAWFDGQLVDLPTYNWMGGWALDINDRDDIVGYLYDEDYRQRATMWRRSKIIDLNALTSSHRQLLSQASAINDRGEITGYSSSWPKSKAFLLIPR